MRLRDICGWDYRNEEHGAYCERNQKTLQTIKALMEAIAFGWHKIIVVRSVHE